MGKPKKQQQVAAKKKEDAPTGDAVKSTKKEKRVKGKGKEWNYGKDDLERQLELLGLRVKQVQVNGCFC